MVRPQCFRERAEEFERASLSTWAVLSAETKGRDRHEEPDPLRPVFQVDAHRIMRSRAFQKLGGKVAGARPVGATRLTVTLEAARLAESLARALRLNVDLARAVALGHALGAPPFGLAGTRALGEFGYDLAEQSVRVVERLERAGAGLNLTWETRDGMLTASGMRDPVTVEGQVARVAVRFAEATVQPPSKTRAAGAALEWLGEDEHAWGDALVADTAQASSDQPEIRLSSQGERAVSALVDAAADADRRDPDVQAESHRAVHCLQSLAIYMLEHGTEANDAEARRRMIDDLACCTDREAIAAYRSRFEPRA